MNQMKRVLSAVLAASFAGAAFAQSFTIVRPSEGATVRETVSVLIPKGSIPNGGYIGVLVNGKFLEAAMPDLVGENYVYKLDTKARKLPDGDTDLEVVLYMDGGDRADIINRSSVRVKLDNYSSIKVPEGGYELRYIFNKGTELHYLNTSTQSAGTVSQSQAALGSRASELPVAEEKFSMLYSFDNVYAGDTGPEALLRMQALPDKGKNYIFVTAAGESEPKKFYDYEMHPLYMRITNTGREVWGAAPPYFPLEGTAGESSHLDLFAILPLPVLPSKKLFPGDTWQAQHLFGELDLDKLEETYKLTTGLASRGTFIGVEWENGIPCAKFNIAVDAGPREITSAVNLNNQPGEATKVSLNGTVWFALDRGIIVKSEIDMLQESLITVGTQQAAGAGNGTGGAGVGSTGGPQVGGTTGGGGATGGINFYQPSNFVYAPFVDASGYLHFFQNRRGGQQGGGPGGVGGAPGGVGGAPGGVGGATGQQGGFGNRTGGGSGGTQRMILRVRLKLLSELEK